MTGPRKTGAQLTSSAASAQPQARRRLLPSCASSRGGPSAQHGLRHLPARRGKRLRSCACLHLPARPGSSGGRSVRSCGRRRTAAASKSHLVEVACELAALDPARGSKPGSNSRTRRAPRWRPRPTPEGTRFLFSASKDLGVDYLHVPISGADSYTYRTRRVPFEVLLPPRRGAAPRVGALVFILGTHPGLVGPKIEGPTETTRHAPPVPRVGGPAVSAAPAPHKLDIPRLLGPQVTPGPNGGHYFAPWPR